MSADDWRPGPRLRAAMDADQVLPRMQRDELGGYGLTVRRFGMRKLFAAGQTAQEAADHMERIIGGGRHQTVTTYQTVPT